MAECVHPEPKIAIKSYCIRWLWRTVGTEVPKWGPGAEPW